MAYPAFINPARNPATPHRGPAASTFDRPTPRGHNGIGSSRSGLRSPAGDRREYLRRPTTAPAGNMERPPRSELRSAAPSMRPGRIRPDEYADSSYQDRQRPSGSSRAGKLELSSSRRPPPPRQHVKPEYEYADEDVVPTPAYAPEEIESTQASSGWGWDAWKKTVWGEEKQGVQNEPSLSDRPPPEGETADQPDTFWAKIATVGASLQKKIVRVDDGYASDATDYDGDSHLIRIMKEYHIEKAQSTRDLPTWLFSAEEISSADARARLHNDAATHPPGLTRARSHGSESRRPGALADIYDSVPDSNVQRHQRGYPKSPRNNHSFDSGYASGPSPPPNRRKYARDEETYQPPQPIGRNRLAKKPAPPAPRIHREEYEDHGDAYNDGPAYGSPRNHPGVESDYGGRRGRGSHSSRSRQTDREIPTYYDEPPTRQAPPRGYPPRGHKER
ncbi:hypothetical protein CROQUDRAFT_39000 [Cronartium quercuum f. sp. fusiforme G11]|uniref:Uncharacterized protein n=1 Tax=Cronartium quercuum f. sp. fusiforme G11 TaxID=708437 RepID=A0A9P6NPT7_9BASI|nr:hypothetical protein CROQUDRAFT_39000 [Cronartium quercuum f. sp. fusiforme G11]